MDSVSKKINRDYKIILDLVKPDSSVLDLGCGNGQLLELLVNKKNVRAQGIEIDEKAIYECVARGLSVFHGDLDTGLVTKFIVEPRGDDQSELTIATTFQSRPGLTGWFERLAAPAFLRRIYRAELAQLDEYARRRQAG